MSSCSCAPSPITPRPLAARVRPSYVLVVTLTATLARVTAPASCPPREAASAPVPPAAVAAPPVVDTLVLVCLDGLRCGEVAVRR